MIEQKLYKESILVSEDFEFWKINIAYNKSNNIKK